MLRNVKWGITKKVQLFETIICNWENMSEIPTFEKPISWKLLRFCQHNDI